MQRVRSMILVERRRLVTSHLTSLYNDNAISTLHYNRCTLLTQRL